MMPGRRLSRTTLAMALLGMSGGLLAHDFNLGNLRVDHPYAVPALAGKSGRVYFRTLKNFGRANVAIVTARSPVARETVVVGPAGDGTPIPIPGRGVFRYRHDQPIHIALRGLQRDLADGEEFPVTLIFGDAGQLEISVQVQQPRLKW